MNPAATDTPTAADRLRSDMVDRIRAGGHATSPGVTVGPHDSFDGIWLNLTATEPGTCRLTANPTAVQARLCAPAIPSRSPVLVEHGTIAYLTIRRLSDPDRRFELGAAAHGPAAPHLAERLCRHITAWNQYRDAQPAITAYPTGTELPQPHDMVIRKQTVLLVMTAPPHWPHDTSSL